MKMASNYSTVHYKKVLYLSTNLFVTSHIQSFRNPLPNGQQHSLPENNLSHQKIKFLSKTETKKIVAPLLK